MKRVTMLLVGLLCFLTSASASAPKNDFVSRKSAHREEGNAQAKSDESNGAMIINQNTEIKLDGRACKYDDIPENAQIILLSLDADKKMILKIHFQTKK